MTLKAGDRAIVRDPKGNPSLWDGTLVSVVEYGSSATKVRFITVPNHRRYEYKIGETTRLTTAWLFSAPPLTPFEESIRSYIQDQFKELGIA